MIPEGASDGHGQKRRQHGVPQQLGLHREVRTVTIIVHVTVVIVIIIIMMMK